MVDRHSPTSELEAAVEAFYADWPYPSGFDFGTRFADDFDEHCARKFRRAPPNTLSTEIGAAAYVLYLYDAPNPEFKRETHSEPVAHARYRDKLLALLTFKDKPHSYRLSCFKELLIAVFEPLMAALPPEICITANHEPPDHPTQPLYSVFENPKPIIEVMLKPYYKLMEELDIYDDGRMGAQFAAVMRENLKQRKAPIEGTPLAELFEVEVPALPEAQPEQEPEPGEPVVAEGNWYAHSVLLAMTRFGKTNAISWRIAQLLPQIAAGRASLVLMEPKGVLTENLLYLAQLWDMRDRVVIIDPSDTSVAVNLFERSGSANETVARVTRVMNTITTNLTDLQRDTLTFAIRALYSLPGTRSMRALMNILRQGKKALPMHELDEAVHDFFEYDFQPGDARYVIARLNGLLGNPIFEALFAGTRTTFDMLSEIQSGKLILIKATGKALAGEVTLYGRFWIEQVNKCIWPRLELPERERTPATFIIDEAQNYIADDRHVAEMLDQAAEAKIGLLFAMHHMGQITDDHVRHSIYTNTAVKFSARTSADIHNLARAMGDAERLPKVLLNLPKYQFYMYTPDITEPIKVKFPLIDFGSLPRISPEQYEELKITNRARYGYVPTSGSSARAMEPPAQHVSNIKPGGVTGHGEDRSASETAPDDEPAQQLAAAYQLLAALTQRGEWEKILPLKASITLLEQHVLAARQSANHSASPAQEVAASIGQPADAQLRLEPQKDSGLSTEASTDWR